MNRMLESKIADSVCFYFILYFNFLIFEHKIKYQCNITNCHMIMYHIEECKIFQNNIKYGLY